MSDEITVMPPLRFETPVLIVPASMRVVRRNDLPAGVAYFVDGETFVVNGEKPYSAHTEGVPSGVVLRGD